MRTTRGVWAAVGAGTSLAAAALLALVCLSVALAVHGWPQVDAQPNGGSVALQAALPGAAHSAAAAAPAPVVLPAPHVTVHRPGAVAHRRIARAAPHAGSPARRAPQTGSGSATVSAPAQPTGRGSSGASPAAPASTPHVIQTASTTISNVTGTVGNAVAPISPSLAGTVTATGQQAGQAIDSLGKTVGGVVGGLSGAGH